MKTIIGYIHICQTGEWRKSLNMLIQCIRNYGLYDNVKVIRLGILTENSKFDLNDEIFSDPKFKIIYVGKPPEYERPTLLHMRKLSVQENNTLYFYLHTKGLRHFGTPTENPVIDWINLMLYWNIERWQLATQRLNTFDTYGCNDIGVHYSGNFWWATNNHIKKLPNKIESYYTAPENWIQQIKSNNFCVFKSSIVGCGFGHYSDCFERSKYTTLPSLANSSTDKNTTHSYLDLYEELLKDKRDTAKYVLEVGIGDFCQKNGGSLKLWREYFSNATIIGIDILPIGRVLDELKNDNKVLLYTSTDGYNANFVKSTFVNKAIYCDFILDDGPHTLLSQKIFIQLYSNILSSDGILVVENVQSIDHIPILSSVVPEHLKQYIKVYDLREKKNRYDDIVFTIDKRI
jgi:hypothetical protein